MSGKRRLNVVVGVCAGLIATLLVAGLVQAGYDPLATVDSVVAEVVIITVFAAVGLVVAYRQPRNALGWLMYGAALAFAVNAVASEYSVLVYREHRAWRALGPVAVLFQPMWAPAIIMLALLVLLFPDARLPLGKWRPALIGFLTIGSLWMCGAFGIAADVIASGHIEVTKGGDLVVIEKPTGGYAWWGTAQSVFFVAMAATLVLCVARQISAYRRAEGERRLQLQWLMWGVVVFAVFVPFNFLTSNGGGWQRVVFFIAQIALAAMPACMGVAILKYRLFDIDRLVSRTLSYAILTALLVGFYIGVVTLTTEALPLSSPAGVAVSTLAAAAVFNPLRLRVQRLVDRRFNRARYDAEATVSAFAAALRGSVDLDRVQGDLVDVVRVAVQPSAISIWVR